MLINMTCPSCGKPLTAPDSAVGKRAKCPGCAQVMIVPDAVFDAELVGDRYGQPSFPSLGAIGSAAHADPWLGDTATPDAPPTDADGEARRPCPECGEMIIAGAAKCRFCNAVFDPRLRGRANRVLGMNHGPPGKRAKQIRQAFIAWWSSIMLGLLVCFGGGIMAAAARAPEVLSVVGLGVLIMLAGYISYFVVLYRLWSVVQDGRAQTTPGAAVGFLFIPCFNIYWQFVSFWGLAKELNRITREYAIAAPQANESLALTKCVLHCCDHIPYLGILTGPAGFVVTFIELKNMCNVAVAIVGTSNA
jgi:predicted RNA-binding Zn-ribbon protein involved in translation (DUF1610 family)